MLQFLWQSSIVNPISSLKYLICDNSLIFIMRMGSALKLLTRYAQEGNVFLYAIVTGGDTWFFKTLLNRSNNDEVQEEVMTCFKGQAADFYYLGLQKMVPRISKYLDNAGDYVEK